MDVGVMSTALQLNLLDFQKDFQKEDMTLVTSGAAAEQFIGQHLLFSGTPYKTPALHYWMRESRNAFAEVDYLMSQGQRVVPIEVKVGKAGTLRSMHYFLKEKKLSFGLRFNSDLPSLLNETTLTADKTELRYELLSLPLYMVGQTRRLLETL
jgi:hypothetical protein